MTNSNVFAFIAMGVITLAGCSRGNGFPPPVPVSGSVSYQGKPVDGASITFLAGDGGGRSASGTTDSQGAFQLTTFSTSDGALPGDYTVTIAKMESKIGGDMDASNPDADYNQMMAAAGSNNLAKLQKAILPEKYADATKSGLKRSVVDGQANEFAFELGD